MGVPVSLFTPAVTTSNDKVSGGSITFTLPALCPAGTVLIIAATWDNLTTTTPAVNGASGITTSLGGLTGGLKTEVNSPTNTGAAGVRGAICSTTTTVDMPAGTTISLSLTASVTSRAGVLFGYSNIINAYSGTQDTATGTTSITAGSVGITGMTVNDLMVTMFCTEGTTAPANPSSGTNSSTSGGSSATNVLVRAFANATNATSFTYAGATTVTDGGAILLAFQTKPDPTITQAAYRMFADGTEAGSTALAAQDTPPTIDVYGGDVLVQVRARMQSTNAGEITSADDWRLQYEKNETSQYVDEYSYSNYSNTGAQLGSTFSQAAQSFKVTTGCPLTQATFYMRKMASPTGTISAVLYAHDGGTYGGTGRPTGAALATSTNTIASSTLGSTNAPYTFTFDGSFSLVGGTAYFIALVITGASANDTDIPLDASSPSHPGAHAYFTTAGGTWTAVPTNDMVFNVNGVGWVDVAAGVTTVVPYPSANLTPAVIDGYDNSNFSSNSGTLGGSAGGGTTSQAQGFVASRTGPLLGARFNVQVSGTPTPGSVVRAYLYASNGASPPIPATNVNAPIATSTTSYVISTLTSAAMIQFDFDGSYELQEGVTYFIGVWSPDNVAGISDGFLLGKDTSSSTYPTQFAGWLNGSSLWQTGASTDLIFEVLSNDGGPTTNRLGAGTNTFEAGKFSQDGLVRNEGISANNYTELMYSTKLVSADLAASDVLKFRILRNGVTTGMTYTAVPQINVTKTPPAALSNQRVGVPIK